MINRDYSNFTVGIMLLVGLLVMSPVAMAADDAPKVSGESQSVDQPVEHSQESLARKATDPTSFLTQFQVQNNFTPHTYDSTGYANTTVLQPVIPISKKKYLPFTQIVRATLPVNVTTSNPDGPRGRESGLGDLTVFDLFIGPKADWGTWGVGPVVVMPTATDRQTGQGKWQIGPAAVVMYNKIPKWTLGALVTETFSIGGDRDRPDVSALGVQPIAVRHFNKGWYAGWGELTFSYEWHDHGYNLPINLRVGKVSKIFGQHWNTFVEPFYTPHGFQKESQSEWGFKLSVTLLLPEVKL